MSNPSLIWRHAFQQQLDDDCRDVLIALSSTPRNTCSLDDLEIAFAGQRDASERPKKRHAFRDALRILDDAFTRSAQARTAAILVELVDPGLEDYIAEWITADFETATAAVRGITYFDQIEWMLNRIVVRFTGRRRVELLKSLAESAIRTWSSESGIWGSYQYAHVDTAGRVTRAVPSRSARLSQVLQLWRTSPDHLSELEKFLRVELREPVEVFRTAALADMDAWAQLLETALEHSLTTPDAASRAVDWMSSRANGNESWDTLSHLIEELPEMVQEEALPQARTRFTLWFRQQSVKLDEIADQYELEEVLRIARDMGVALPDAEVDAVWDRVLALQDEDGEDSVAEPREERSTKISTAHDEAKLAQLFGRLIASS